MLHHSSESLVVDAFLCSYNKSNHNKQSEGTSDGVFYFMLASDGEDDE